MSAPQEQKRPQELRAPRTVRAGWRNLCAVGVLGAAALLTSDALAMGAGSWGGGGPAPQPQPAPAPVVIAEEDRPPPTQPANEAQAEAAPARPEVAAAADPVARGVAQTEEADAARLRALEAMRNRNINPFAEREGGERVGLVGRSLIRNTNRMPVRNGVAMTVEGEVPVGQLLAHDAERDSKEKHEKILGIRDLEVHCDIEGAVARTTVKHVFENQTDKLLEGVFTFALPPGAAVDRFAMTIVSEDDLMEASLVERNRARTIYTSLVYGQAIDPGVLEWMDNSTFRATIFPIPAKGTKTIVVSYLETLPHALIGDDLRVARYTYPLTMCDVDGNPLPPAARVHLSATVRVAKGTAVESSFETSRQRRIDGALFLETAFTGNPRFEKDWTLDFGQAAGESAPCLVQAHRPADNGDGVYGLTLTPPAPDGRPDIIGGQDVIFMIDTSGSREGTHFAGALRLMEGAVATLRKGDRFTVVPYDVTARPLPEGWLKPDEAGLERALSYLALTPPMGATDVGGAFTATARHLGDTARAHTRVVFLGDTQPTYGERDEEKLREIIAGALKTLHAEMIAVYPGKGLASMDHADETQQIKSLGAISGMPVWRMTPLVRPEVLGHQLAEKLRQAVIAHARVYIDLPGELLPIEATPAVRGGLFGNVSVNFYGKYARPGFAKVTLKGTVQGQPYVRAWRVELPRIESGNAPVAQLWARAEIERQEAIGNRKEALDLALKHKVVSQQTAFLVLESEEMFRDFGIKRALRDRVPMSDVRRRFVAGQGVPVRAEESSSAEQPALPTLRLNLPSAVQAINGPVDIDGVDVAFTLRKVEVPRRQSNKETPYLTEDQCFERRLKLSRRIASERGLPFEPETVFGEMLLGRHAAADFLRDRDVWNFVDRQGRDESPAYRQLSDATPDRERHLKMLMKPAFPTAIQFDPAGGERVWIDGSQYIHDLAHRVAGLRDPGLIKDSGESEERRAMRTRHKQLYDLRQAPLGTRRAFYHFLSMTTLVEGQVKLAREAAHRALQIAPPGSDDAPDTARMSHLLAGLSAQIHGDYNDAAVHYERMLKGAQTIAGSGHDLTYWSLVTVMAIAGNKEGAVAVLEKWAASATNRVELARFLGRAYLELNRVDDATRAFSTLIEADPSLGEKCPRVEDIIMNLK